MKNRFFLIIALFLVTRVIYSQDCNLNEEGKKHWYKAEGIREVATDESNYQLARDEYLKALEYAPNCPDIYYNLGACCEEIGKIDIAQFDVAISYFNKYLSLLPNAADKEEVQARIYKIEGKKDKYKSDQLIEERKQQEEIINEVQGRWEEISGKAMLSDFNLVVDSKGLKIIPDNDGKQSFDEGYISIKDGILYFSLNRIYRDNEGYIKDNVYEKEFTSYSIIYGTLELTSDGNLKCSTTTKWVKNVSKTGAVYYKSGYYAETGVSSVFFYRKIY